MVLQEESNTWNFPEKKMTFVETQNVMYVIALIHLYLDIQKQSY